MTVPTDILELPLHLVGVSDQVTDWLRQAGFPVVRLGQESILKSAFGLKRRQSQPLMATPVRCLLFDSRDVWSRAVVKSYQNHCCCKLDVATLLVPTAQDLEHRSSKTEIANPVRFGFLEQLKQSLESLGGLWARLADFPFPYQGVGCLNGELPAANLTNDIPRNLPHRLDLIRQRYNAGLPTMISTSDLSGLADMPPVTGLQSRGLPLLWRAEQTDFAQWWQQRNRLELKLWQSPTHYRVDCPKLNTSFCPVLEIWRGNHMASIPLRSQSIVVRKDGLVFQQQPNRHPAGFTAGWPDTSVDGASSCPSA